MPLRTPQRGEIWWANLSRDARGTEIGAGLDKKTGKPKIARPTIIVSINEYNEEFDGVSRVTVVPVMQYREGQELDRSWGFKVPIKDVDEEKDAKYTLDYPISLADCGHILTINMVKVMSEHARTTAFGIFHNGFDGRISGRLEMRLQNALQISLGDSIRSPSTNLPVKFGDIIEMDFTNSLASLGRFAWLVISSTGVDSLRYHTYGEPNGGQQKRFSQVTAVLIEQKDAFPKSVLDGREPAVAVIDVEESGSPNVKKSFWLAHCHEIQSVDWETRNTRVIGRTANLSSVRRALSEYLGVYLPAP